MIREHRLMSLGGVPTPRKFLAPQLRLRGPFLRPDKLRGDASPKSRKAFA
jgi:hypothetical protein